MSAERRQHNRINVHWKARLLKKGLGVATGVIENASIGGVFVRTSLQLAEHDKILLEFVPDYKASARRIVCECELMRRIPDDDETQVGYGLRFHRIKDDDVAYLLGIVAHLWRLAPAEP